MFKYLNTSLAVFKECLDIVLRNIVRTTGDGWMVGLGDPVGLFQPCDSMILNEVKASLCLV